MTMTVQTRCYMCYRAVAHDRRAPFVLAEAMRQRIDGVRHVRRGRVCTRRLLHGYPDIDEHADDPGHICPDHQPRHAP